MRRRPAGPAYARSRAQSAGHTAGCARARMREHHQSRHGTRLFNAPVHLLRNDTTPRLTCTFSTDARLVEIGLSIGRPPQPATRDTLDWWGKQRLNSLGSGSCTARRPQSQIVASPHRPPWTGCCRGCGCSVTLQSCCGHQPGAAGTSNFLRRSIL